MAIKDLPSTLHTDSSGERLVVESLQDNVCFSVEDRYDDQSAEVWLSEQQVKNLIDDLAARIGCYAVLGSKEITGWTTAPNTPITLPGIYAPGTK